MINSRLNRVLILVGLLICFATNLSFAAEPPPKIVSTLIIQIIPFEKNLMVEEGDMTIHVVGSTALADALKEVIGWKIGKRTLGKVTVSDSLPTERPDIMCITDKSKLKEILAYTEKEKILSIANNLKWVKKGVSLGIDVNKKGDPSIKLNLSSAKKENLNWNSAVFKIAKTVK